FHLEQSSKVKNYSILRDESSTVRNENNSYDVVFKLKFTPTGDANDDGELTVADAVLLQKWLLAVPDTDLKNWKAVDFCNDNRLDVFDLYIMKRELLKNN
ncbi:MAG: dockerin type I repeat-containing protein, partial [Ruminococcus sp.]|nr:dockerin type I repeat-containing protein [Ruminococcus sp.]